MSSVRFDRYIGAQSVFTISMIFFFFNDTATTEIYTLSLHDALPIYLIPEIHVQLVAAIPNGLTVEYMPWRSEEHTSELQSQSNLVCRLLLEKKKESRSYSCVHI